MFLLSMRAALQKVYPREPWHQDAQRRTLQYKSGIVKPRHASYISQVAVKYRSRLPTFFRADFSRVLEPFKTSAHIDFLAAGIPVPSHDVNVPD